MTETEQQLESAVESTGSIGVNAALHAAILDARTEVEELNECGDAEDRLAAAQWLADLEACADDAKWHTCHLCNGVGSSPTIEGDTYAGIECMECNGRGGKFL